MNDKYFRELTGKQNPYDKEKEYYVRKIIEKNTNPLLITEPNKDSFGYDTRILRIDPKTNNRWTVGFVEIEISESWVNGWKEYWKFRRFVARKVVKWENGTFYFNQYKHGGINTLYLRWNKSLTDCYCCPIFTIMTFPHKNFKISGCYKHDVLFYVEKNNSKVVNGIKNCMKFIDKYFMER